MPSDFDDRDDRRGDDYDRPRRRGGDASAGGGRLIVPAVGLLVTGLLGLGLAVLNVVNKDDVGPQLDQRIQDIQNDPNIPADQKKTQVDLFRSMKGWFEQYGMALYGTNAVVALIVMAGAGLMFARTGRGLSYLASILAMLPIINGCCCLAGLPFGIWAIIALGHPDVKAAYQKRSVRPADDY